MCKWQLKFRCRPNVCGMTTIISRMPYFCRAHCCQHLRSQDGKIVKEMPVPPEQRPEHVRHGQADVGVRDVG